MNRVVVTHKDDAQRYIKSGWTLESEHEVILPGINKQYTECTLYWKQSGEPAAPDGPEVELKTKDVTPSPKRRRYSRLPQSLHQKLSSCRWIAFLLPRCSQRFCKSPARHVLRHFGAVAP